VIKHAQARGEKKFPMTAVITGKMFQPKGEKEGKAPEKRPSATRNEKVLLPSRPKKRTVCATGVCDTSPRKKDAWGGNLATAARSGGKRALTHKRKDKRTGVGIRLGKKAGRVPHKKRTGKHYREKKKKGKNQLETNAMATGIKHRRKTQAKGKQVLIQRKGEKPTQRDAVPAQDHPEKRKKDQRWSLRKRVRQPRRSHAFDQRKPFPALEGIC